MTALLDKANRQLDELASFGRLKTPIAIKLAEDLTLTSDFTTLETLTGGRVRLTIEAPMTSIPVLDLSGLATMAAPPVPETVPESSPRQESHPQVHPWMPRPGDVYLHRKTGNKYVIIGLSIEADNDTGRGTPYRVTYAEVGASGLPFSRRLSEFVENVDVNGSREPRFVRLP